jgi:hypothetical protein
LFPSPRLKSYFGRGLPALAVSYLFPFGVLIVGFLLRYDGPPHPNWRQPPEWRAYVLYLPILLHIVFVVGTLVALRRRRVRAAALLVPGLWLSLCALPPAGFAIAGVGP